VIPSLILCFIFLTLAGLHFYWAIGGTSGFENTLPTEETGERVLHPKKFDSLAVALGLTAFGAFYMLRSGFINYQMPQWVATYAGWGIPIIFIIRSIGDFKYIGLFKRVKTTPFAKLDTKYYTILCLLISILGIIATFV
jgi:hypothetical protein